MRSIPKDIIVQTGVGKQYDPFLDFTRKDVSAAQIKARMEAGAALAGNKPWVGYMRKIRDGKGSAQELLKHLAAAGSLYPKLARI
jgi:uncharacterized membrane-anchored protein